MGSLADKEREVLDVFKSHARTFGHSQQRILGNVELYADLVGETFVKTADERAAAGEPYTVVYDIGVKFGGSLLQRAENGSLYL